MIKGKSMVVANAKGMVLVDRDRAAYLLVIRSESEEILRVYVHGDDCCAQRLLSGAKVGDRLSIPYPIEMAYKSTNKQALITLKTTGGIVTLKTRHVYSRCTMPRPLVTVKGLTSIIKGYDESLQNSRDERASQRHWNHPQSIRASSGYQ